MVGDLKVPRWCLCCLDVQPECQISGDAIRRESVGNGCSDTLFAAVQHPHHSGKGNSYYHSGDPLNGPASPR